MDARQEGFLPRFFQGENVVLGYVFILLVDSLHGSLGFVLVFFAVDRNEMAELDVVIILAPLGQMLLVDHGGYTKDHQDMRAAIPQIDRKSRFFGGVTVEAKGGPGGFPHTAVQQGLPIGQHTVGLASGHFDLLGMCGKEGLHTRRFLGGEGLIGFQVGHLHVKIRLPGIGPTVG